jgi:hypothetical protein
MENDYESGPATPNSASAAHIDSGQRWRSTVWGSAAAIMVAFGVVVAALGLSAGAQLANSPEAVATTVRATPPMPRPAYTAEAPSVPGQLECTPSILMQACPPSRPPAGSNVSAPADALAWFNKAKGPFNAIQDGLQSASKAMQAQNMDGVHSACQQVLNNSQMLGNTLPSPDAGLTTEVRGAVDELTAAANLCLAPNATSNTDAIMSHVQNANSHFSAAQQIIQSKT